MKFIFNDEVKLFKPLSRISPQIYLTVSQAKFCHLKVINIRKRCRKQFRICLIPLFFHFQMFPKWSSHLLKQKFNFFSLSYIQGLKKNVQTYAFSVVDEHQKKIIHFFIIKIQWVTFKTHIFPTSMRLQVTKSVIWTAFLTQNFLFERN